MTYCIECGAAAAPNGKFCHACGKPIHTGPAPPVPSEGQASKPPAADDQPVSEWTCGACCSPLFLTDGRCSGCGEPVEWPTEREKVPGRSESKVGLAVLASILAVTVLVIGITAIITAVNAGSEQDYVPLARNPAQFYPRCTYEPSGGMDRVTEYCSSFCTYEDRDLNGWDEKYCNGARA